MKSLIKKIHRFKIDGLSQVVILGFISNIIEGLAFAQLLQIPYLSFFSSLVLNSTPLAMVALYLLIYRLGRLSVSLFDSKLPYFFQRNGFTIGLGSIGFGLILTSFSVQQKTNLIFLSAIFFGLGTTLSGLNLRELLTSDNDVKKKRHFNVLSNVGWSVGVCFSGFLLQSSVFRSEFYIAILILIVPFVVSIDNSSTETHDATKSTDKASELVKLKLASKDLLIMLAIFALMVGLISNQINSSIMNQVTKVFGIKEGYQSLVLLLPIFGSLLSLVPAINNFFKRSCTFGGTFGMILAYFLVLVVLTLTSNLIVYCIFLTLVGLVSNEILTAIYQVVATKQEPSLRRGTHALVESVTVVGSLFTWISNKFYAVNTYIILAEILIVPCLLLLFITDVKSFFIKGGTYDQSR